MSEEDKIELSASAAEIYERDFVPAMFAQWAPRLADMAEVKDGDRVLDVGCGTGVFAREALTRVGASGKVTGLDLNESMLDVGRRLKPQIDWHQGDIMEIPFEDNSFEIVGSQFVLMFMSDRVSAIKEMWRVLAPGGRLIVSVWSGSPAYAKLQEIAQNQGAKDVADSLFPIFILSNEGEVLELFKKAGIPNAYLESQEGTVTFPSIDEFVQTEIKGWVLGEGLDETIYENLLIQARDELSGFCDSDGRIVFHMNAHLISAHK